MAVRRYKIREDNERQQRLKELKEEIINNILRYCSIDDREVEEILQRLSIRELKELEETARDSRPEALAILFAMWYYEVDYEEAKDKAEYIEVYEYMEDLIDEFLEIYAVPDWLKEFIDYEKLFNSLEMEGDTYTWNAYYFWLR